MFRFSIAGIFALAVICVNMDARAQNNSIDGWFELNSYHPSATPGTGFLLERSSVLQSLQLGMETEFQTDNDPLAWQKKEDGEFVVTETEVERLLLLHLNVAMGFFGFMQLGVQMPFVLDHGRLGAPSSGAAGDLRLVPKFAHRFHFESTSLGISATMPIGFPTGRPIFFTGEGHVSFEPVVGLDVDFGRVLLLVNAGMFLKEREARFGLSRGKEFRGGLGADFGLMADPRQFTLSTEVYFSTQTTEFFDRFATPVEAIAGLNYRFDSGIALSAAAGMGISSGVGAPTARLLIGVSFVPKPFGKKKESETIAPPPPDMDKDGIPDDVDFCKEEAEDYDEYDDDDGCPELDNDEDGIPDVADKCANIPENVNGVEDTDGCPENDYDGDGIADPKDDCQEEPEDLDGFLDEDGCPDTNNDLDHLSDGEDACPLLPESKVAEGLEDGCPDTIQLKGSKITFFSPILFARNEPTIRTKSAQVIDDLANAIKVNPQWLEVQIEVHVFEKENEEDNFALSEQRAIGILKELITRGVSPDILAAKGYGNTNPTGADVTVAREKKKTVVEIVLIEKGDAQ